MTTFVEENCTVQHEGKTFESGGAWLCDCSDGFRRGVVYVKPAELVTPRAGDITGIGPSYPRRGIVTDWHGNKLADAFFGMPYRGNFCRMRTVRFTVDGVLYTGRYCPDTADAVRVKSTKRVK